MAPWVHTYLSPQMERRLCCASLEKATNFNQYIDTKGPTSKKIQFSTKRNGKMWERLFNDMKVVQWKIEVEL